MTYATTIGHVREVVCANWHGVTPEKFAILSAELKSVGADHIDVVRVWQRAVDELDRTPTLRQLKAILYATMARPEEQHPDCPVCENTGIVYRNHHGGTIAHRDMTKGTSRDIYADHCRCPRGKQMRRVAVRCGQVKD